LAGSSCNSERGAPRRGPTTPAFDTFRADPVRFLVTPEQHDPERERVVAGDGGNSVVAIEPQPLAAA
jgi:hypothetical protein